MLCTKLILILKLLITDYMGHPYPLTTPWYCKKTQMLVYLTIKYINSMLFNVPFTHYPLKTHKQMHKHA